MNEDELYMRRCLQLAALGKGFVAPNPLVGAALVYKNRIIGEGYHQQFGAAHAEVNCINSVKESDKPFISSSTLYVSLEPCAHYGKTPPCSTFIIQHNIPKVVIGCRDVFKEVNGKGIEQLQRANVEVVVGVLEEACKSMNERFFTFHEKKRPYVILKWAQTANGYLSQASGERLYISNEYVNRLVHAWRSEEMAIIVGSATAIADNPQLTNRLWTGKSPLRMVIDRELKLPAHLNLFQTKEPTVVFNYHKHEQQNNVLFYCLNREANFLEEFMRACVHLSVQSLLVEGGSRLLQLFLDAALWDELRIITHHNLVVKEGVKAPVFQEGKIIKTETYANNCILYIKK